MSYLELTLLLLVVWSCVSTGSGGDIVFPASGVDFAKGANERATSSPARVGRATEAVFGVSTRLPAKLTTSAGGNVLLSPLSVASVAGQLLLGAQGYTKNLFTRLLAQPSVSPYAKSGGISAPLDIDYHLQFKKLLESLSLHGGTSDGYELRAASAFFIQRGFPLYQEFEHALADIYKVDVYPFDFRGNPTLAQNAINEWAHSATHGRISTLFAMPPPPTTALLVANAVYFKGAWETPFDPDLSFIGWFQTDGPLRVAVNYMRTDFPDLQFKRVGGALVVRLPYKGNVTSMYIVMPDDLQGEDIRQFMSRLDLAQVIDAARSATNRPANVVLPKMTLQASFSLKDAIGNLERKKRSTFSPSSSTHVEDLPEEDSTVLRNEEYSKFSSFGSHLSPENEPKETFHKRKTGDNSKVKLFKSDTDNTELPPIIDPTDFKFDYFPRSIMKNPFKNNYPGTYLPVVPILPDNERKVIAKIEEESLVNGKYFRSKRSPARVDYVIGTDISRATSSQLKPTVIDLPSLAAHLRRSDDGFDPISHFGNIPKETVSPGQEATAASEKHYKTEGKTNKDNTRYKFVVSANIKFSPENPNSNLSSDPENLRSGSQRNNFILERAPPNNTISLSVTQSPSVNSPSDQSSLLLSSPHSPASSYKTDAPIGAMPLNPSSSSNPQNMPAVHAAIIPFSPSPSNSSLQTSVPPSYPTFDPSSTQNSHISPVPSHDPASNSPTFSTQGAVSSAPSLDNSTSSVQIPSSIPVPSLNSSSSLSLVPASIDSLSSMEISTAEPSLGPSKTQGWIPPPNLLAAHYPQGPPPIQSFSSSSTEMQLENASPERVVRISDVVHHVWLEVSETGTEAAAVTMTVVEYSGMEKIVVEKPFVAVVVDEPSKAPLFWAAVVDPTGGRGLRRDIPPDQNYKGSTS